jgi:two-component system phosphate regulon sensor histidine kinase PhoR
LPDFWGRSMATLAVSVIIGLVVWLFLGKLAGLACFALTVLGLLLFHLRQVARLQHWLLDPQLGTIPENTGTWETIYTHTYQKIRTQARSQQKLSTTLDRFISAGEAMPDGVVILNEKNHIEWFNPLAMRHFGLDRNQDIGQQISYLVRQPHFASYLKEQDFGNPLIFRQRRSDQVLSIQLVPFDSTRKLLLSRDITQLEKVHTVHRDFVANVSHELRTPLTVIGGFLETLLDMDPPDHAINQNYMALMQVQTTRMQRIVENLLTLSRLESNQEILKEESVDLSQLLQIIFNEAQELSQGRHTFKLDISDKRGIMGQSDELHSAFGNLVSNAIRYTPENGEIKLSWRIERGRGIFSVSDTGPGIESEHIPRLTERFYRVDKGRSRDTGGTGLGLAIVKHILLRHQAVLDITSTPGRGSCFCACFPAERLTPIPAISP